MKKIAKYESNDGKLWDNENDAIIRDLMLQKVSTTLKLLGKESDDEDCSFANGGGYYQLDKNSVENFDKAFIKLMRKYHSGMCNEYYSDCDPLPTYSLIGRCLSDSNCPMYELHCVRGCIDKKYRKWGQPYFALNPNEGDQIDLGKKEDK